MGSIEAKSASTYVKHTIVPARDSYSSTDLLFSRYGENEQTGMHLLCVGRKISRNGNKISKLFNINKRLKRQFRNSALTTLTDQKCTELAMKHPLILLLEYFSIKY